jgi:hypothetical protein
VFIRLSGTDKLLQQDDHSPDRMSRSSELLVVLAKDPFFRQAAGDCTSDITHVVSCVRSEAYWIKLTRERAMSCMEMGLDCVLCRNDARSEEA